MRDIGKKKRKSGISLSSSVK